MNTRKVQKQQNKTFSINNQPNIKYLKLLKFDKIINVSFLIITYVQRID